MTSGAARTGLVLLAMGGPGSVAEIRDYLHRLFQDPMLIRLPGGQLFRRPLASYVSRRRAAIVAERYQQIGGGSPLLAETSRLRDLVAARLDAPVAIGMRYSAPFADDAVAALRKAGISRAVAIPLYPQFSTSTSGSSLADAARAVGGAFALAGVTDHHVHPGYLAAMASRIEEAVGSLQSRNMGHILFTAHSIPVSLTRKGDPYVAQVKATVEGVTAILRSKGIELPSSLAFQSRVRFGTWHGPDVADVVSELAANGTRRLVVAPVSFVSENLETRYDLDIELREICCDEGYVEFQRAGTLSDSPLYAGALAELARAAAVKSWGEW
ncbi:MAG: ferrochelatase [Deltaproteobacteria bacterium]|nr:ferrochelatase [Deltaproteobacteria bacterium]